MGGMTWGKKSKGRGDGDNGGAGLVIETTGQCSLKL